MPPKATKSTTAAAPATSSRVSDATPPRQSRQASKSPSKPSPTKTTQATSSTPKKSTSVVAKKKPPTPARTTRGKKQLEVDKDDESSEDESEEEEVVVAPVKNKKDNIKTKGGRVDDAPTQRPRSNTTKNYRPNSPTPSPTSLTRTPRKYPLLHKDINVTDQFSDQKGQVSIRKAMNRPDSTKGAPSMNRPDSTKGAPSHPFTFDQIQKRLELAKAVESQRNDGNGGGSLLLRAFLLLVLFLSAIAGIWFLYEAMPPIEQADKVHIKLPRSIEEAKALSVVVDKYKELYPTYVFALFAATYIFLQAFAIPGAVFLSILAGPIWGIAQGIVIISLVATTGSSCCFLISKTIARPIFEHFFPARIQQFKTQLDENRDNLFFYLLFLRIAPVFPNWLITVSSPIIDVPYIHFAVATFIGIMPNNYIMTTVGSGLQNMTNDAKLMTPQAIIGLFGISLVAILPIVLKKAFAGKKSQ